MALIEKSVIVEITALPQENNIQVRWRNTVERDSGEIVFANDHYKLYNQQQKADIIAEVEGAEAFVTALGW